MNSGFLDILNAVGMLAFAVIIPLIPLMVWTFCQQARRPTWTLAIGYILIVLLPLLSIFFVTCYSLIIIITHRARVKAKRQELATTAGAGNSSV